jgi:hypothetical protein
MTFALEKGCLQADTDEVCSAYCKMDGFHDDGGQHPFSANTVTDATCNRECPAK